MDAKIGDWVVTARIGKPVELQCLWINALRVAERADATLGRLRRRAHRSFLERFPREAAGLYDVVDVNHQAGENDATFRPNQIFAVGGLPLPLLRGDAARRLVDAVEDRLWTPLGLRSLDPRDRAYAGRYEGNATERDAVYHQGTVWPWLAGPFVEAWIRSRGNDSKARAAARTQFVEPLMQRLQAFGLGHLPEIADGDPPHTPRGAPFQAWSLGELIRLRRLVDHDLRNGRTSWPRNDLIQSESA
jgi:glycogen debranching enzyme